MVHIASIGQSKPKRNDWIMENLLEKVKTVKQTCYKAIDKSGEIIKGRRIDNSLSDDYSLDFENTYSTYHQTGHIEVRYGYNADDSLVGKSAYKYDNNWNLVEVNSYDSSNVLITNSTYKYDKQGNEIESSSYLSGIRYYKVISKYDNKGNEIETIIFNRAPGSKTTYKSRNTYKYDDKGNQVEIKRYGSDGAYDSKVIYTYDDKGHVVEYNVYNPDGSIRGAKQTNKYDDKGNMIEKNSLNPDGSYDHKRAYKYDERGNLIEWSWYKSDGTFDGKISYNYKYDNNKNWILKICNINNKP